MISHIFEAHSGSVGNDWMGGIHPWLVDWVEILGGWVTSGDEVQRLSCRHGLRSALHVEPSEAAVDVRLDRAVGDKQPPGNGPLMAQGGGLRSYGSGSRTGRRRRTNPLHSGVGGRGRSWFHASSATARARRPY